MITLIKRISIVSVVITLTFSCKEGAETASNTFSLEGEIKGLKGDLYYRHPDREYSREYPSDTIKVVDGKIKFSDTISKLSYIRAFAGYTGPDKNLFKIPKGGRGYFPVKSAYLAFYAFPGAKVTISGEATDFMNAYPSGDAYNDGLATINKITYPKFNAMGNLAVANTHETDSVKIKANQQESEAIFNANTTAIKKHIKNNPKSLAGLWYLEDMIKRNQIANSEAIALFESVSEELSDLEQYQSVQTRIDGIKDTAEGSPVPSIKTTATLDGSTFDMNSLRGKYVMIDFWGTWCGPCVNEMPTVKTFQEKHKDKLVVLGINSGDTKEKMQKFLEDNDYNWPQLISAKDNTADNFVNRFNVKGFPTKFIIDPRGTIVKRFVGGGEEAFTLLDSLLTR